jgi:hypothetical protein
MKVDEDWKFNNLRGRYLPRRRGNENIERYEMFASGRKIYDDWVRPIWRSNIEGGIGDKARCTE